MQNELKEIYENGFGIKLIAKYLKLSYTNCRKLLFDVCKIEMRKGRKVSTEITKKIRKEKAIFEKDNKIGWFKKEVREKLKIENKTHKGVQGYYFNKSLNKFVWLRSSYEYIFAKWLDRTKHLWDSELKTYKLENALYKPDFFILNENNDILKIIEIKGYFDNRSYKVELLNEKLKNIDCVLLNFSNTSIQPYIEKDSNYLKELEKWKIERIKNKKLKEYEN